MFKDLRQGATFAIQRRETFAEQAQVKVKIRQPRPNRGTLKVNDIGLGGEKGLNLFIAAHGSNPPISYCQGLRVGIFTASEDVPVEQQGGVIH